MLKVGVEGEEVETYKLNLKPLIQSDADKLIAQLKQNLNSRNHLLGLVISSTHYVLFSYLKGRFSYNYMFKF